MAIDIRLLDREEGRYLKWLERTRFLINCSTNKVYEFNKLTYYGGDPLTDVSDRYEIRIRPKEDSKRGVLMAEKLIWNDSESLFFKASEFSGARIDHMDHLHNNEYVIRIYLRGIIRSVYRENEAGSLRYEVFTDEESAKKCLAELAKKIE